MSKSFFESNSYFVDEKVNFFKFENVYQLYNDKGENIGAIKQKVSNGHKALRVFLSKAMLPFLLEIKDNNDTVQASIRRGWTLFVSKVTIHDAQGNLIGFIKQKFTFVKPTFKVLDLLGNVIADINGNWLAKEFTIKDVSGNQIGTISKKWAGAAREFFTTADKYNVNIDPNYSNTQNKITILAAAITIDMVLKEFK